MKLACRADIWRYTLRVKAVYGIRVALWMKGFRFHLTWQYNAIMNSKVSFFIVYYRMTCRMEPCYSKGFIVYITRIALMSNFTWNKYFDVGAEQLVCSKFQSANIFISVIL